MAHNHQSHMPLFIDMLLTSHLPKHKHALYCMNEYCQSTSLLVECMLLREMEQGAKNMHTSDYLEEESIYTREILRYQFHITDATINNGVFKPSTHQSIWLFVTEQKTIDRPQLKDLLQGNTLYWDGQPMGRTDKAIIDHQLHQNELLVFYRKHTREFPGAGFRYKGRFQYKSHTGSHPTHFILQKITPLLEIVERDLRALHIEESYFEGKRTSHLVSKHERNPKLREATVRLQGTRCQVCDFSFAEAYGSHGEGFIEVHHLHPISLYPDEMHVNPSTDMAVVCANCHRMLHRNPDQPLSIDELKKIMTANPQSL